MPVQTELYGQIEGRDVRVFTITRGPLKIRVIEYGATLTECHVPDSQGVTADVVLGFADLEQYQAGTTYFGASAGRYGNRIRRGLLKFDDGQVFQLSINEGENHLHGGKNGFDSRIWQGELVPGADAVRFTYRSPDGEEGYPGTLDIAVIYALDGDDRMSIQFEASTDKATVCNPVHHSYWNLGGHASGPVLEHDLAVFADFYIPIDEELLATGEILSVEGTAFDFREAKAIGRDLQKIDNAGGGRSDDTSGGYDHNLVLRGRAGVLKPCIVVTDPVSGRAMEMRTTEPGLQFYTGGYLNPSIIGKGGHGYSRYAGFTLETQKFPCAPEFGHFQSAQLNPGEKYLQRMEFRFFARPV